MQTQPLPVLIIALVYFRLKLIMKRVSTMRVIPHNHSVQEILNETSWL